MGEAAVVRDLICYLAARRRELESLDVPTMQGYIAELIREGRNTPENIDALAHHLQCTGNTALYLYVSGLSAGREVLPSIAARLTQVCGEASHEQVFGGFELPPLGTPQRALPPLSHRIVTNLRSAVGDAAARDVLAGNHHGIPAEGFAHLRQVYLESGIDAALAERHRRLVATLERHLASGQPWFEQIVTADFVEHVRSDQEVGAGVRDGGLIYFSKVPFSPQEYLDAEDPVLKRYYMCHCPLAREGILDQAIAVDPMLCYCSAGFTRVAFDVIFGQQVDVEVVETALSGATRCRFAIKVPAVQEASDSCRQPTAVVELHGRGVQ